ncbi:hypothetical protein I4U23_010565 [Adineta vaga]|nr:hypothetical protein I4U23_010565 [Adineta vaga]
MSKWIANCFGAKQNNSSTGNNNVRDNNNLKKNNDNVFRRNHSSDRNKVEQLSHGIPNDIRPYTYSSSSIESTSSSSNQEKSKHLTGNRRIFSNKTHRYSCSSRKDNGSSHMFGNKNIPRLSYSSDISSSTCTMESKKVKYQSYDHNKSHLIRNRPVKQAQDEIEQYFSCNEK